MSAVSLTAPLSFQIRSVVIVTHNKSDTNIRCEPPVVSLMAWSLHLISSVGEVVRDEKNAAKNPENALSKVVVDSDPLRYMTTFWQFPYAANRTEFSAMFAASAGDVPA